MGVAVHPSTVMRPTESHPAREPTYSARQTAVGAVLAVALVGVPIAAASAPAVTAATLATVALAPRAVRAVGRWAAAPAIVESSETPDASPTRQKA